MGLSSTDKLAKELGHNNNAISNIQQNISPDEEDAALQLRFTDNIDIVGHIKLIKKAFGPSTIAFDRIDIGAMFDNPEKRFDVRYDEELDEIIFEDSF